MNESDRKMLTEEVLGEGWPEYDNPAQQIYIGTVCIDKNKLKQRTFTTWQDLGALKDKLVEKDWIGFINYAHRKFNTDVESQSRSKLQLLRHQPQSRDHSNQFLMSLVVYGFSDWLFTPARFCQLVADWWKEVWERLVNRGGEDENIPG